MDHERPLLPNFESPPVVEVVLSVHFEPVPALHGPYLGLAWCLYRDEYPHAEQHPPVDPVIEILDNESVSRGIQIQVVQGPPTPRYWFVNSDRTEIVQLQPDRLTNNWRKVSGTEEYPRFDKISGVFADRFTRFVEWIRAENLGEIKPVQCEVTYVNHIDACEVWKGPGEAAKVFSFIEQPSADRFLPEAEAMEFGARYAICDDEGSTVGRLYASAKPIIRAADRAHAFRFELMTRGSPEGVGIDGIMRFMNRGHVWIVKGFADLTTSEMHAYWRRTDDK